MVNWQGQKIFITGGNGFLGSWLVLWLLNHDADVTCLIAEDLSDSMFHRNGLASRVRIVRGRVEDAPFIFRTIGESRFSFVFHLAAQAIVIAANRDPLPTFDTNIMGTWNILEACRRAGDIRAIVVASSDKAYGDNETLPYKESHPLQGCHPYDASKACADLLATTYAVSYGLPTAIVRCGNIIGAGDFHTNRLVPGTSVSLLRGERPIVRSDGLYTRDYVSVDDVVDAYVKIAAATADGAFNGWAWNISYGQPLNVLEIVRLLREIVGRPDLSPVILNEATNEIREQYLDSSRIRSVLGWTPRQTVEDALVAAVSWHRSCL